jgi:group I intron endonuclease
MEIIGTYILTDTKTKKFYVGSSGNIKKRIKRHIKDLINGTHHCSNLQNVWRDDSSLIETVFPTKTREEAYLLEQDIINRFSNSSDLLNIGLGVRGGDNLTKNPNRTEILVRIKEGLIKTLNGLTPLERKTIYGRVGNKNGMWGQTHTVEAHASMSKAKIGQVMRSGFTLSPEHKKILSEYAKTRTGDKNPFFGRTHSAEVKKRLSDIAKAKNKLPANIRGVEADGVSYISVTDAARKLGISPALIIYRINSKLDKYSAYRYVSKSPTTIEHLP